MKKKNVKLSLNRETLQNLNTDEMPAVQGGASVFCATQVNCVSQNCPTKGGQWFC